MGSIPQGADFESMSKDELANFINSNQGAVQPNGETDVNDDQSGNEGPTEDNPSTPTDSDQDAAPTNEDQGQGPTEDNPKPKGNQFESKTYDELLGIIKEQQSFIGRQASTIGELKKVHTQPKVEPKAEPTIDPKGYREDDIKFVRELIKNEFGNITKQQREEAEQQKIQFFQENQQVYGQLQQDAKLFEILKPILDQRFAQVGEAATYQKGWVKAEINHAMRKLLKDTQQPAAPVKPTVPVVDKTALKKKATTIQGGGAPPKASTKTVTEMTANEYLKHITETMGIKPLKQK